jgi:large subunit ribosomal protein L4
MKHAVINLQNKDAGSIDLDDSVFGVEVKKDLLHSMVKYQLASRRAGTQKTKTVSEVSGTGKKPFKQKGTGHARAGTQRAVQHRGGGTAHGILPRSYAISMNKKQRKLALKSALSAKLADKKLIILDEAKAKTHKTKDMAKALETMGVSNAVVVTGAEFDVNFARAIRNIPCIDVLGPEGANVYDILRRDNLILTKEAVAALTERLSA